MALAAEEVYGVSNDSLSEWAQLRAQMMGYRDERDGGRMHEEDWRFIETTLARAYTLLQAAVRR